MPVGRVEGAEQVQDRFLAQDFLRIHHRSNRDFFYVPVKGDFVFHARVKGQDVALYDQAGLPQDAENWMKRSRQRGVHARFFRLVNDAEPAEAIMPD